MSTGHDAASHRNPVLANVHALTNELTTLRTRTNTLEAMVAESKAMSLSLKDRNDELERENTGLRHQLDDTRQTLQAFMVKKEDSEPNLTAVESPSYQALKLELENVLHQIMLERLEHSRSVDSLNGQLADLTEQDKEVEEDLDRALNANSSDMIRAPSAEASEVPISGMSTHDTASSSASDSDSDLDDGPFDPERFLKCGGRHGASLRTLDSAGLITLDARHCDASASLKYLRDILKQHSIPGSHWTCLPTDNAWSSSQKRCLLLLPYKYYDPDTGKLALTKSGDNSPRIDETRDLFHREGGTWSYCGTYKCIGITDMDYAQSCDLTQFGSHMHSVMYKTMGGSSQETKAKNYRQRIFRDEVPFIRCCGLVKVAHNPDIDLAFEASRLDRSKKRRRSARLAQSKR